VLTADAQDDHGHHGAAAFGDRDVMIADDLLVIAGHRPRVIPMRWT
jgi:hypothetical protein